MESRLFFKAILKAKESILSGDVDSVRQSLESIADNLIHLKSIMTSLHGKLIVEGRIFHNNRPSDISMVTLDTAS